MKGLSKIDAFRVASSLRQKEIEAVEEFKAIQRMTPRGGTPTGGGSTPIRLSPMNSVSPSAARVPHSKRMPAANATTPKDLIPDNFVLRNKKITEYIIDGDRKY